MIKQIFHLIIISAFMASCSGGGKQYFTDQANDFKILFPTINGNWCIETKALILGRQIELTAKSFFKDKYLYQVLVLSAATKGNNPASKAFMESFHLK